MKRESGSEVKMPVAAEEARRLHQSLCVCESCQCDEALPGKPCTLCEYDLKMTTAFFADIQRRTMLACADAVLACDIYDEVERLAASLGEPGK